MYIYVEVQAAQSTNEIKKIDDTHYKASVNVNAVRGMDNEAVLKLLKGQLPDAKSMRIEAGQTSTTKKINVQM